MNQGLQKLFSLISPIPNTWIETVRTGSNGKVSETIITNLEPVECNSYKELVEAWDYSYGKNLKEVDNSKIAIKWNDAIDVAFSLMLAVVASTKQQGAQFWLRVLGPPGSVKSTLCNAIEANKEYVYTMSKLTGFHSGTEGSSIINSLRNMTCIVNEGDMLLSLPQITQTTIMGEMRDLWSGKTSATYKNGIRYEESGIRTTFIIAGTQTLRRMNRSAAGDRYLDIVIHERKIKGKEDEGERDLLDAVIDLAIARTKNESMDTAQQQDTKEKQLAIQKTAGFVQYLRRNASKLYPNVEVSKDVKGYCRRLAQLVAYMRARPDTKGEGEETEAELATRLCEQFIRAAMSLSVVLNRKIDKEILRRLALMAKHTSKGPPLTICEVLLDKSLDVRQIEARTDFKVDTVTMYKNILLSLGCINADTSRTGSGATKKLAGVYRLTPQMTGLIKNLHTLLGEVPMEREIVK